MPKSKQHNSQLSEKNVRKLAICRACSQVRLFFEFGLTVKQLYGSKERIVHYGYVDFLGENQYNIQQYYVLRKLENGKYHFKKTVSEGKANALQLMGWELIKIKGTNHVDESIKEII